MVLLDPDHLSLLQRGCPEGYRIKVRLGELPPDQVATTIINYEEQMRGGWPVWPGPRPSNDRFPTTAS